MSNPGSRQRSPEGQNMSRSASMFNQQQQQQSFYPLYTDQTQNMQQMHQLQQQQQQQLQQQHNEFGLSPPLPLQSTFPQYPQQVGMMDLNQVNQHLQNFNLINHESSPPPQGIDPNFILNSQAQNQSMNPQDVIGSNFTSPTMQNIALQSTTPNWSDPTFQAFRGGHARALSDYSDVSPHRSPNLVNQEFGDQPSPLLVADQGTMLGLLQQQDNFGLEHFNLSDHSNGVSPHHSPHISPHLTPQHTGNSGSGLMQVPQLQMYQPIPDFSYSIGPTDMVPPQDAINIKQEDRLMVEPPLIEVDFAPPQRQPTFPGKLVDALALSPPIRNKNQRQRSASDPPLVTISNPSRPATPGLPQHAHSYTAGERRGSLHPHDVPGPTLSSQGTSTPNRGHTRRSSTSALPNRDYILDLAAPTRPGANATDSKRVQKHPATFQCHLCPKRFTRAYNLRSHLRTHTDERPFVCTVCGKAFARQHDRKRHEGLHSGEKKFVCRGDLKMGGHWGCGRRFARADALGRHFRSEAGRICIKPLLDEEAAERMAQQPDANAFAPNAMQPGSDAFGNPLAYPVLHQLPMALIAQYPALASAWEGLAQSSAMDDDEERRNNYDMSGSEYDDMGSARNSFDGSAYSRDEWSGDERWASDTGESYGDASGHAVTG